jgi:hypothetical protein
MSTEFLDCQKCGTSNLPEAPYCFRCRSALGSPEPERCGRCGTEVVGSQIVVCPTCGASLEKSRQLPRPTVFARAVSAPSVFTPTISAPTASASTVPLNELPPSSIPFAATSAPTTYDYVAAAPRPKLRRLRYVILSGVVAAVVVVALLLATGVISLHQASSPATVTFGPPFTDAQAISPGISAQTSAKDGPWSPTAIVGIVANVDSTSSASTKSVGATGCSTVWSASKSTVAPATPSDAGPGQASWWMLASSDASGDVLLTLVTNVDGSIQGGNIVILSGSCTSTFTKSGGLSSSAVSSSAAIDSANAAGGSTFLTGHPGSTEEMFLIGSYWDILYTTCAVNASGGSGTVFSVVVYAQNATVAENLGTSSTSC